MAATTSVAEQRAARLLGHLQGAAIPARSPQVAAHSTAAEVAKPAKEFAPVVQLRYTLENGKLTQQQREFYEENGFLVFKKLLPSEDLAVYRDHFTKLCNNETPRVPTMTVMRDVILKQKKGVKGEDMITKLQDWQDDDILMNYCRDKRLLDVVEGIVGPNIRTIHTMLIHKPPNVGESGRHPFHQDLYYFPIRPADRIVCAWTAMEKIDRTNGCLSVIPGSHRSPLYPHGYPEWNGMVNKAYHGVIGFQPPENRLHLIMEEGDTVFFHPLLLHASGANRSQGYRKSISCHYASSDCFYIDVRGTIQDEMSHEIEGMAKTKTGAEVDFIDIWRFKSRLVRGKDTNLV